VLALYTDGLVEQPGQDLGTGMYRLARALGESRARSLDDLGDSVLAGLGPPPVTTSPCCSPPGQAREPRGLITRSSRPALESVLVDNRRVDDLLGVDPLVFVVPPHLGRVSERDVVDVEQDLVLALAVPDLAAGIAAVGQDGADGVLGPRDPTAMPVPVGVVRGWAREALGGQPLGNEVDPEPARNSAKIRRATAAAGMTVLTKSQAIAAQMPVGVQIMSRDSAAIGQGMQAAAHQVVLEEVAALRSPFRACSDLAMFTHRAAAHMERLSMSKAAAAVRQGSNIFIGHGRSAVWRVLKEFVQDRLHLPWDEFNRVPVAGITNIARLSQMLDDAGIAFLILTAEDERADGEMVARQNVIRPDVLVPQVDS
jgi:hypothetical protein